MAYTFTVTMKNLWATTGPELIVKWKGQTFNKLQRSGAVWTLQDVPAAMAKGDEVNVDFKARVKTGGSGLVTIKKDSAPAEQFPLGKSPIEYSGPPGLIFGQEPKHVLK